MSGSAGRSAETNRQHGSGTGCTTAIRAAGVATAGAIDWIARNRQAKHESSQGPSGHSSWLCGAEVESAAVHPAGKCSCEPLWSCKKCTAIAASRYADSETAVRTRLTLSIIIARCGTCAHIPPHTSTLHYERSPRKRNVQIRPHAEDLQEIHAALAGDLALARGSAVAPRSAAKSSAPRGLRLQVRNG